MLLQLLRKYTQYSDEDLVDKYQTSGDVYYVALLFDRYNEMTVSLALNYLKNERDAEDAVMECFEVLVNDLKKASIKNFGGWYYSVARNYLLKVKRHRMKHFSDELIEGYHDEADEEQQFKELLEGKGNDLDQLIEEVLKELKPIQATCITAFYLEDKNYKTIAKQETISEKKVKSHLQNGKRKLKIELEKRNVKSVHEIS